MNYGNLTHLNAGIDQQNFENIGERACRLSEPLSSEPA